MKRIIGWCCLVVLTVTLLMTSALADNQSGDGWTFSSGVLTISGNSRGETGISFGSVSRSEIKRIVILPGVTTVSAGAFKNTKNLGSVSIPDTVRTIEENAFSGSGLKSVDIPGSVTTIEHAAFMSCEDLTSVKLHEGLRTVGNAAFMMIGATRLTLPDSVTTIGASPYLHKTLDSGTLSIGSGLQSIDPDVFGLAVSVHDQAQHYSDWDKLNENLTERGRKIEFRGTLEQWNKLPFPVGIKPPKLEITTSDGKKFFGSFPMQNGLWWYMSSDGVLTISGSGEMEDFDIYHRTAYAADPIAQPWEDRMLDLRTVVFQGGVRSVGNQAFCRYAIHLSEVRFESPIERIGVMAFIGANLSSVKLPGTLRVIGGSAFSETPLYECVIPDGVTELEGAVFGRCENLQRLQIPASVQKMVESAIDYAPTLSHVYYGGSEAQWKAYGLTPGKYTVHYNSRMPAAKAAPKFTDVPGDAYFAEAVKWAVEHGVTDGTSDTTFSPNDPCTRGQIVTFLWRSMGSPEPKNAENPFKDVKEGDYFRKAVLWAKENGITDGTSETAFSPNDPCTRGQVVTFLWRLHGQEARHTDCKFQDVKGTDYYLFAVIWAFERGITDGTDDTHFSPALTCTRAQIVTMIFRESSAPAFQNNRKTDLNEYVWRAMAFFSGGANVENVNIEKVILTPLTDYPSNDHAMWLYYIQDYPDASGTSYVVSVLWDETAKVTYTYPEFNSEIPTYYITGKSKALLDGEEGITFYRPVYDQWTAEGQKPLRY